MKKFLISLASITLFLTRFDSQFCHAEEGELQHALTWRNSVFNVMDFGARGISPQVDTKAFSEAWAAACKVSGGVVLIPAGHKFSIQPVEFTGTNCQPNTVFQVDGNLTGPQKSDWRGGKEDCWILFRGSIKGLAIIGSGLLDGNGQSWWRTISPANPGVGLQESGDRRPFMLKVYDSKNVTVSGITLTNSPRMHIFVYNCQQVEIHNVKVSSPGNSPNTDAIHVSNSQHVRIHHSNVSCGDDCVSIQTGCDDIGVYNVQCNPGHGFSIGGLGDGGSEAAVSNVFVRDSSVTGADSLTGVRIKTWANGSGYVRNVTFSNIHVSQVERAIVINQHYDDKLENSGVLISGVTYENITGTYGEEPIVLDCCDLGCRGITISGEIMLTPSDPGASVTANCSHAYGQVLARNPKPPLGSCLLSGGERTGP